MAKASPSLELVWVPTSTSCSLKVRMSYDQYGTKVVVHTEGIGSRVSWTFREQESSWCLEDEVAKEAAYPLVLRRDGVLRAGIEWRAEHRICGVGI